MRRLLIACLCVSAGLVAVGLGQSAGQAKGKADGDAVRDLIKKLKEGDVKTRRDAAADLQQLGPAAGAAATALVNALQDGDKILMDRSGKALRRIGRGAVPALVAGLEDKKTKYHWRFASILGDIGPDEEGKAVAALTDALKNDDGYTPSWAAGALKKMGTKARSAIPNLIDLEKNENLPDDRSSALSALGAIGRNDRKEVLLTLVGALQDNETEVQVAAAHALQELIWVLEPALAWDPDLNTIQILVSALASKSDEVRNTAIGVLRRIGPSVVPALIPALRSQDRKTRAGTVLALAQIRPAPISALIEALEDDRK